MPADPWRAMVAADLAEVSRIAALVHPDYPEDDAVFAERLALFPAGCLFAPGLGYALAHPWTRTPPALNTRLGGLPARPSGLYLHDLALLPAARGRGLGRAALRRLEAVARGMGEIGLVAVGGARRFWEAMGFAEAEGDVGSYGVARYMVKEEKDFFF